MVDFVLGVKKPFEDIKTLIIGIILAIIPIVNILTVPGFGLRTAEKTLAGDTKLPRWENFGDLIVKSIVFLIVGIIYFLPALIVLVVGVLMFASQLLTLLFDPAMMTTGNIDPTMFVDLLGPALGIFIVVLILGLIALFLLPAGLLNYVSNNKFASAFSCGTVIRKALTANYIIAWIFLVIWWIILAIIAMVISFIPLVGLFIGTALLMYAAYVADFTWFAQAYSK